MSPESTASAAGSVIAVAAPAPGASLTVQSEANAILDLAFNPAEANTDRVGNDLVFTLDGGGTVTLQGFFEVGDESLPDLRLPDGSEIASLDFLSGADFDLSTAAGPAGGQANPSSGSGEYADDPGAAVNGINRIGMLGTDYWGRATEIPEVYSGVQAGGTFNFGVDTDLGDFHIVLGAFEDGQPYQHLDGQQNAPTHAAQINFNPQPNPGSSVGTVTFWDLPEGTRIYLGDPSNNPGATPLDSINGTYTFDPDDFTNPGVYIVPPANTDGDFDFSASVQFNGPNNSVVLDGTVSVIVDAVADKPKMGETDIDDTGHTGHANITSAEEGDFDGKGWHKTEQAVGTVADEAPESLTVTIPFETTINYSDFTDSSETHYALIQVPGGPDGVAWSCKGSNGTVYEKVIVEKDPDSDEYFMYNEDGDVIAGPFAEGQIKEGEYFRVPVDAENGDVTHTSVNSTTGQGSVTVNVELEASGDTDSLTDGSVPPISVGGMAQEHPAEDDEELDLENNAAFDWQHEVQVPLDVINSTLTVKTGWASEANNDAKHIGGTSDEYAISGKAGIEEKSTVVDGDSGLNQGAPIIFTLDGGEGNEESVTQIVLTYDSSRGSLDYDGTGKVVVTPADPDDPDSTMVIVTITGDDLTSELADGALTFTPETDKNNPQSYNDADVDVHYELTVENGTGVSATYEGDTIVAVDAVADKPTDFNAQTNYDGTEAAALGETISISGSVTFPDTADVGQETHYILLNLSHAEDAGWTLPGGYDLLSRTDVYDVIEGVGGEQLNLKNSGMLSPTSGNPDAPEYLLIEIVGNAVDGFTVQVVVGYENGQPVYQELSGITVEYNPADNSFSYSVDIKAPGGADTGDSSSSVWVKPITVVNDPQDGEYDYANNVAWGNSEPVTVDVSVATSTVTISTEVVYEGDNLDKNVGNKALEGGGKITISQVATSADPSADPSGEAVNAIALFYGDGEGQITVNGVAVPPGGGLTFTWEEVDGSVVYTGAQIVDADGKPVAGGSFTIDPAQSFDDFVNDTLDVRYTPNEGSISDVDVTIDIVTSITDPASGDTKVVSSGPNLTNDFTESMTDGMDPEKVRDVTESDAGDTVVVDAVADFISADDLDIDTTYAYKDAEKKIEYDAARPGETVKVSGSASFDDNDGSEHHYIVVSLTPGDQKSGWQFNGLDNSNLLSKGAVGTEGTINDIWASETGLNDNAILNPALTPNANVNNTTSTQYLMFGVHSEDGGKSWIITVYTAEGAFDVPFVDGVADLTDFPFLSSISYDGETLSYELNVVAPDGVTTVDSADIYTKAVTIEDVTDDEHIDENNIAWTKDADKTTVTVAPAEGLVKLEIGKTFEDGNANDHLGYGPEANSPIKNENPNGAPITLTVSGDAGNNEYIGSVYINFTPTGHGALKVGTIVIDAPAMLHFDADGNCIEIAGLTRSDFSNGNLKYVPNGNDDTDVDVEFAATIVDPDSGATVVSTNIDGWDNSSDLGKELLDGVTQDPNAGNSAPKSEAPGSNSTAVVDAVADHPETTFVDGNRDGYVDVAYADGKGAAQPGGTVTIKNVTVTFDDYQDGSESHYLLVEQKDVSASSGSQLNTLPDQTLTMTGNGQTLVMVIEGGKITKILLNGVEQGADSDYADYLGTQVDAAQNLNGGSYFQIPVPNEFLQVSGGSVTTDVDVKLPNGYWSDQSQTIKVGGMAEENNATDSGTEIVENNKSFDLTDAQVKIDVVTSAPVVKATQTYENSHQNAHEGFVEISREFNTDGTPKATPEQIDILRESAATLYVDGMKDVPSRNNPGETITRATFTVDNPNSDGIPGHFIYNGVLLPLNATGYIDAAGNAVFTTDFSNMPEGAVKFTTGTGEGGSVTITLEGDNIALSGQNNSQLQFAPNENFDSDDLDLDHSITVTDHGSGHSKTTDTVDGKTTVTDHATDTTSKPKDATSDTEIKVDAVAQQPDFEDTRVEGYLKQAAGDDQEASYYNDIAHGETAHVRTTLDLHGDISDGTESHIFYVKVAEKGYSVQSVTLTYTGVDGETYTITVPQSEFGLQKSGNLESGGAYQTVEIESVINKYADQQKNPGAQLGGDGKIDVDVEIDTPSDGSSGSDVLLGASSHENWYAVQENGDKEFREDNNHAWQQGKTHITLSSAEQPSFSIDDVFYENSNATANKGEGNETWGAGVRIGVDFGDDTDSLVEFNLAVTDSALGDFYIFGNEEGYTYADFVADVKAGNSPYDLLGPGGKYEGKVDACGPEIDMDEISGHLNGTDDLADGHQIVFMPKEDSFEGTNPTINGTIVVKDGTSGQYKDAAGHTHDEIAAEADKGNDFADLGGKNQGILGDAVAQRPDLPLGDESVTPADGKENGGTLGQGETRTVSVVAEFNDTDTGASGTEHFILVEAGADWVLTYTYNDNADGSSSGTVYTVDTSDLVVLEQGGNVYYKVPVDVPDGYTGGDSWTAEVDITLKAPSNSIHKGGYDFEVVAASRDKDTSDGELTFHNNTAHIKAGDVSGNVGWGKDGDYIFEQREALYEDNKPNSHLGDDKTTANGLFLVGHDHCPNGTVEIECDYIMVDGVAKPVLELEGGNATWNSETKSWTVELDGNGDVPGGLKVSLSDDYINSDAGRHNDGDLSFGDVTFKDSDGTTKTTIPNQVQDPKTGDMIDNPALEVAVDAVADRGSIVGKPAGDAWDGDTNDATSNRLDDAVVGGGDDPTAHFTVNASFPDMDGSEAHYILVEQQPQWVLTDPAAPDTVFIDNGDGGKTYYRIPVTEDMVNEDGSVSMDIEMTYTGSGAGNNADTFGRPSADKPGVFEYDLNVGTMAQEKNLSGHEGDMQNNVAVNIDGSVTLNYSPVDSDVSVSVTPTSDVEIQDNPIHLTVDMSAIDPAANQDELVNVDFTISPEGIGELYFADADGKPVGDPIDLSNPLSAADLINAGGKLVFIPDNDFNHQDVTFEWTSTVRDTVSGATKQTTGSVTVEIDAEAQVAENQVVTITDKTGDYTGVVESGGTAIIRVDADFPDLTNSSEQHWAVVEQSDRAYSVTGAVIYDKDGNVLKTLTEGDIVTKFDSNGKPYFAVEIPKEDGCYVEFSVSTPKTASDIDKTLNVGTIVIDNTKDTGANGEPDYDNNWHDTNIKGETIYTGLLETKTGDVNLSVSGAQEDEYTQVTFTAPKLEGYNESAEITIKGVTPGGAFYEKDDEGNWKEVTVLDGEKAANGDYYFKADNDASGPVNVDYAVKVTDNNSGATATYDKSASLTVGEQVGTAAVTETDLTATAEVVEGNPHLAAFSATFSATYTDAQDTTETQYFVWQLPEGVTLTEAMLGEDSLTVAVMDAETAAALGLPAGGTYVYAPLPKGTSAADIEASFTADHTYTDGSVIGTAVAGEDTHYTGGTQWSVSEDSTTLDVTVPSLNEGPKYADSATVDAQGLSASGTADPASLFTDDDGDTISISGIQHEAEAIGAADGLTEVAGRYGSLVMDSNGEFTYSIQNNSGDVLTFGPGDSESFTIHGTDGYGGSAESTLTVNFDTNYVIGTDSDDVMIARTGGETFAGGGGDDTFVWNVSSMSDAADSIFGFDYTGNADTGDKIVLENLFADESELNSLIGSITEEGGLFSFKQEGGNVEMQAQFTDNELLLTLKTEYQGETVEQTINVGFDSLPDSFDPANDAAVQDLLSNIIRVNTGG